MRTLLSFLIICCSLSIFAQAGSGNNLKFNGSSNYVECGTINLSGSNITLQGWVNVSAFKTTFPYISSFIGTEQSGSQCAIRFGDASLAANKPQFVIQIGSNFFKLDANGTLNTNQWYHIAATYDGSTMKLYINGILDNTLSTTGAIQSNDLFEIGRNYGNDRILNGELDEISVFNTALTQTQIRDWMCRRLTNTHPAITSLLGYWPLDEGTGTSTTDLSGNNYNGTLISNPTWKTSGAPIGDESANIYASTAINLGLGHPNGDSLHIVTTSGTFEGLHIYRVDSVPNDTVAPSGVQYLDTTRYWGVFPVGSANYTGTYFYNGNPTASGITCELTFSNRINNASQNWNVLGIDTSNYTSQFLGFNASGRNEIILSVSNQGPHQMNFSLSEPNCFGLSDGVAYTNVTGGQAPYTYSWSNSGTADSASNLSASTYYLTVTDANNCVSTDSIFVTQPNQLTALGNTNNTLCLDTNTGNVQLSVTGGTTPYSYLWSNGSTIQNANQLNATSYTVTVTDANGCTQTNSFNIGSTGPDPMPFLGNDTTLCNGIVYGLSAQVFGGPFTSYDWSTGNTGQLQVVNSAGTFAITVQNAVGCSGSDTIQIDYVAAQEVDLGPDKIGIGQVTLDAGTNFKNYNWNTGSNSQTITVNSSGTYWVKTTDTNGCKDADTVTVELAPSGIESANTSGFNIYPNPTSSQLNIVVNSIQNVKSVAVYNLLGSKVYYSESTSTIDVSEWKSSTYFITVETIDGNKSHLRFLKL